MSRDELHDAELTRLCMTVAIRTAQLCADAADTGGPDDWRVTTYRSLARSFMTHGQEGTGSKVERDMHRAIALAATILGVRQA